MKHIILSIFSSSLLIFSFQLNVHFLGAAIHACRVLDKHIVALEEDKDIFDAMLAPLIRQFQVVPATPATNTLPSDDPDEEDVVVHHIVKKSRFNKSLNFFFLFSFKHLHISKLF
jgi:hypothetical protein